MSPSRASYVICDISNRKCQMGNGKYVEMLLHSLEVDTFLFDQSLKYGEADGRWCFLFWTRSCDVEMWGNVAEGSRRPWGLGRNQNVLTVKCEKTITVMSEGNLRRDAFIRNEGPVAAAFYLRAVTAWCTANRSNRGARSLFYPYL